MNHEAPSESMITPLTSLKLSNSVFERKGRTKPDRSPSDRKSHHPQQTPKKDGFSFEYEMNSKLNQRHSRSNKSKEISKDEIKKVQHLASMLLDTRRTLQADSNVVNSSYNEHHDFEAMPQNESHQLDFKISRQTHTKAERVKSMISVKYLYIQRIYESSLRDSIHPNVEGVYNPIQILRNRQIAERKQHELPKILTIKLLPLACNVFSRHNNFSSTPWRMLWSIDLNEYFGDISWRRNNWDKLRAPNGALWFPPNSETDDTSISSISTGSSIEETTNERLHDKLFDEPEGEDDDKDDKQKLNLFQKTREKSRSRNKRIKEKMKKHTKKLYTSASSSSSGVGGSGNASAVLAGSTGPSPPITGRNSTSGSYSHEEDDNRDPLKEQFFKRLTPTFDKTEFITDDEAAQKQNTDEAILASPPQFKLNNQDFDINDVMFNSVEHRNFTPTDTIAFEKRQAALLREHEKEINGYMDDEEDLEEKENGAYNQSEDEDQVIQIQDPSVCGDTMSSEMSNLFYQYNYFESLIQMRMKYIITIYPHFASTLEAKLNRIIHTQLTELFQVIVSINDHNLPEYESLYDGFSNEVKSVIHLVSDNYSIKIDNLLSNSDRSIGEINTSLLHELRKVNEKLDKLNVSLFSSNYSFGSTSKSEETSNSETLSMSIKEGEISKMMYFCLENLIVVLLRVIWVVVNIYKLLLEILKFFWRIVRFILF